MHQSCAIVGTAAAAVLAWTMASAAAQEPAKPPRTVKEVMTTMTVPASEAIFRAASESPRNDEQWAALGKAAETLAASGRLLMTPALARDTAAWTAFSRTLVAQATALSKITEAKRGDALEQAGNDLYETCETCHMRYLEDAK